MCVLNIVFDVLLRLRCSTSIAGTRHEIKTLIVDDVTAMTHFLNRCEGEQGGEEYRSRMKGVR